MPVLVPPIVAPNLTGAANATNDVAVKDKKVPLSQIVATGGWHGKAAKDASAVALAESGGDASIDNGSCCVGLWQINRNHAGENGTPRDTDKFTAWLKDPYNNAHFAHHLWAKDGGTFAKEWDTWKNSSYKAQYGKDPLILVKKGTASGAAADVIDTALKPLELLAKLVSALFDPSTYLRLGKGVLGGFLVIMGTGAIIFVVANKISKSPAVKNVRKTAKVAEAAAAV